MAKIKWGLFVTDGRGKVGGHVLSKNLGGAFIRTKVTPTNPQTTYQTAVRALFGQISQSWSGLSDSVRAGWQEAVASWQKTDIFGDLKSPSGKALFQRLNNQAQSAGYPAVTAVPAKLDMVSGIVTGVDLITPSDIIPLTGAYAGADARVVLSATAQLSAGTRSVGNKLRQIYSEVANAYDPAAAYTAYTDKFGVPTAGANVYFSVKYVLPNGQASPAQIIKGFVQ